MICWYCLTCCTWIGHDYTDDLNRTAAEVAGEAHAGHLLLASPHVIDPKRLRGMLAFAEL